MKLPTADLSKMPSAIAAAEKLKQMLDIRKHSLKHTIPAQQPLWHD